MLLLQVISGITWRTPDLDTGLFSKLSITQNQLSDSYQLSGVENTNCIPLEIQQSLKNCQSPR